MVLPLQYFPRFTKFIIFTNCHSAAIQGARPPQKNNFLAHRHLKITASAKHYNCRACKSADWSEFVTLSVSVLDHHAAEEEQRGGTDQVCGLKCMMYQKSVEMLKLHMVT